MRVLALGASVMVMSGCSVLFGLDGLGNGTCESDCVDGAPGTFDSSVSDDGPTDADASVAEVGPPLDAAPVQDATSSADSADGLDGSDVTDARDAGEIGEAGHDGGQASDASEASCTPPAPPSLDDCTGIVALPATPVIDGVLDCGVPLWPMPLASWTGPGALPSAVQAMLAVAWRPNGLYFFVHVTGDGGTRYPSPPNTAIYCGDAVELYVDDDGHFDNPPNYDDPGTIQLIAPAPSNAMVTSSVGSAFRNRINLGSWTGNLLAVRTSDGFDLEAFVVASDLGQSTWALAKGSTVGLYVSVDLGDPANQNATCPRLGQLTIEVPPPNLTCDPSCNGCDPSCNVADFCIPHLDP